MAKRALGAHRQGDPRLFETVRPPSFRPLMARLLAALGSRSFGSATLFLLLACLIPAVAWGQAPTDEGGSRTGAHAEDAAGADEEAAYEQAVRSAIREFALGNFPEARMHFLLAHQLRPSARTLRGLGKVEYELRHYFRSVEYLDESLTSKEHALTPAMREEVEALLTRARGYVGKVRFQISPHDAEVKIDGVTRELSEEGTLTLDVGEYSASIRAPGHVGARLSIEVTGGQSQAVKVTLLPTSSVAESADAPTSTASELAPRRKRWAWALSAAVVAVGAGLAVGLAVRDDAGESAPTGGSTGVVLTLPQ